MFVVDGLKGLRGFVPLLIPVASARHKQDLSALVVHVPIISATRRKSHVGYRAAGFRQRIQIRLPDEILAELFGQRLADTEHALGTVDKVW